MSGQTSRSMVHKARPPSTSHSSFLRSGRKGTCRTVNVSGKRKENVLQASCGQRCSGAQISKRSGTAEFSVGKQQHAVGNAFGIRELVNSQNKGAAVRRDLTDQPHDVASLPQVEAVEWLVH